MSRLTLTETELQDLLQRLYDAEDLACILQRLDEADCLNTDPPSAHVATLSPLIRMRINEAIASLNAIESKGRRPTA